MTDPLILRDGSITAEDFARAILHGWTSCEVRYHMEVMKAYRALADPICTDKYCECKDAEMIQHLLQENI